MENRLSVITPISDDLLHGAAAIAEFIFGSAAERRRVSHLATNGGLPCFRLGAVLCARKSTLLAWIAEREKAS
jgi:hypothetical protein